MICVNALTGDGIVVTTEHGPSDGDGTPSSSDGDDGSAMSSGDSSEAEPMLLLRLAMWLQLQTSRPPSDARSTPTNMRRTTIIPLSLIRGYSLASNASGFNCGHMSQIETYRRPVLGHRLGCEAAALPHNRD